MHIDWFTVIAEMLNFIILVWLLSRFLYKPVLRAVKEREKHIAKDLADAEDKEKQAEAERKEYEQKKLELGQQRASILKTATDQAADTKKELLEQARTEATDQIERYHTALAQNQSKFSRELIERTQHEVLAISAKVLTDLADEEVQSAILRSFIRQLKTGEASNQQVLPDIKAFAGKPLTIRSSVELNTEDKQQLSVILQKLFTERSELSYETDPELIGGYEIVAEGHKITWSIASYLEALRTSLDSLMQEFSPPSATEAPGK